MAVLGFIVTILLNMMTNLNLGIGLESRFGDKDLFRKLQRKSFDMRLKNLE